MGINPFDVVNLYTVVIFAMIIILLMVLVVIGFQHPRAVKRAGRTGINLLGVCKVCGGELEAGNAQGVYHRKGAGILSVKPVASIRCTKCGHLEFFTDH